MYETFQTPAFQQENIRVVYVKATAAWSVTNKRGVRGDDVAAYAAYGIARKNAYEILEDMM